MQIGGDLFNRAFQESKPHRRDAPRFRGADHFFPACGRTRPYEIFPFRARTTKEGIAAAADKLGDLLGIFLFRV
jgi:hypothetical protein